MIKCPKCEFEQPPDRYCAQCGVNMETFKAPRPPLSRQLAGSGAFLGFLIGVVIFATAYLIYNQQQAKISKESEQIAQPEVQAQEPARTQEAPSETPAKLKTPEPPAAEQTPAEVPIPTENLAAATPTTTTTSRAEEASRGVAPVDQRAPSSFSLVFVEIPQSLLTPLFAGATDVGQTGTLSDLPARLNKLKDLKTSETLKILARYPLVFEGGVAKHSELLGSSGRGLSFSVATRGFNPEFISVEVLIENRGLIAGSDAADGSSQSFQGVFDLSPKAAGYFADLISKPTGLSRELETEISRSKVFQILNSPAYNQRQSSLFIFFQNGN